MVYYCETPKTGLHKPAAMEMDPHRVEFCGHVKSARWRTLLVPHILATTFAFVGQPYADTQEDLDRLPDIVQADLNAVSSTEREVEIVESELRTQEGNRTLLLQQLQQARTRDKKDCAPPNPDQRRDLDRLAYTLAPGNGEGLCRERNLEALIEEERTAISAMRQAGYSPEHPEIKRAERVIQELQARIDSGKNRETMLSLEVVQLEIELKDVEAQVAVLEPRYAEVRDKLSKAKGRLQSDVGRVTVNPPKVTRIKQSCNLAPLMVCGTPAPNPAPAYWYYGYTENAPVAMRLTAPGGSTDGPGNFRLVQLTGGSGPEWVSQNLAGDYNQCLARGKSIQADPGNESGPVAQGLDTRFGDYIGNMSGSQTQYPPDVNTTHPSSWLMVNTGGASGCSIRSPCIYDGTNRAIVTASNIDALEIFDYKSYQVALKARHYTNAPPNGQFNRRILSLPVGNCSSSSGGSSSIPIIGFACFFLLQEPIHSGNSLWFLGQYVRNCKH